MINIKQSILKDIEHDMNIINAKIAVNHDVTVLVFLSGRLSALRALHKNISKEY